MLGVDCTTVDGSITETIQQLEAALTALATNRDFETATAVCMITRLACSLYISDSQIHVGNQYNSKLSSLMSEALIAVTQIHPQDFADRDVLNMYVKNILFRSELIEVAERDGMEAAWKLLSKSLVPKKVQLTFLSQKHCQWLLDDPNRLKSLSDSQFEILVADRLTAMGMGVKITGNSRRKDGGIDIVAWPEKSFAFPFLLAAQVKHHSTTRKTGSDDVRNFYGAITSNGSSFNLGIIVTNTSFTADAKWFASNNKKLLRLRDLSDLCRWMKGDYVSESEWREIPCEIELAPGIKIEIPKEKL